ncbi:immunoglobulin superfamily DCC subclass member 3-like [Bombina bombina]|uniref:immunoglobulin superfamily DCC subclass member 3-like n=1 Tax=Bombina bombina TaxID=8345 RepID=UPI00235AB08F|nr:immunoglobulin superfamily DCC subclass member 3-like [Bombina bombina]
MAVCLALSGDLSFLLEPADSIAVRGRALTLNCQAEGEPPINITWYKNGNPLSGIPHIQQLSNGSLWIRNLQKRQVNASDAGEYSCAAQNRYGKLLSRKARIQLAFLSRFHLNPQPMSVAEGGVARFQCLTTAVPTANITWERNRTALLTSDQRFTLLPAGVLQITGVTHDDIGMYRCLATNVANSRYSDEAPLTLAGTLQPNQNEPIILSGPQNLTLVVHQTAILECIASGNPRPIVSWSRLDGQSIGVEGIQVLGTGNLVISDVSVKHSGVYVCAANRPGTRVRRTAQGMLLVQAPPEFVQWPQSISQNLGGNATFHCMAQGVPEPTLLWLKNGKHLSQGENIILSSNNSTLTIVQVSSSDEALYQCIAENTAGTNQASSRLAVSLPQEAPKSPEEVTAVPLSTSSIQLTWKAPSLEVADRIIGYVLHIRKAGEPSSQELQEALSKTTFRHVLTNLEPSTTYSMFLRSYSPLGASSDSNTIFATTLGKPPKTPELSVSVVNDSAVQMSWLALPVAGQVQGYKLAYRKIPYGEFQGLQILPGNISIFTYSDLEAGSRYEMKLVAFNGNGEGNCSLRFVSLRHGEGSQWGEC